MSNSDPFKLHTRLQALIDHWFGMLEHDVEKGVVSPKELKDAVTTVGAYLLRDIRIRAADESDTVTGSKVRGYSGAFKTTNVPRRREAGGRPTLAASTDPDDDGDDAA